MFHRIHYLTFYPTTSIQGEIETINRHFRKSIEPHELHASLFSYFQLLKCLNYGLKYESIIKICNSLRQIGSFISYCDLIQ